MFTTTLVNQKPRIIHTLSEMKPLQIGRVVSKGPYHGDLVMRTARKDKREIMSISQASIGSYWRLDEESDPCLKVELLPEGTEILLTVTHNGVQK